MDGWMDGWMSGCMDGWMDELTPIHANKYPRIDYGPEDVTAESNRKTKGFGSNPVGHLNIHVGHPFTSVLNA
jgi:hypothetical protein